MAGTFKRFHTKESAGQAEADEVISPAVAGEINDGDEGENEIV
jgi:hypothetical protein